MAGWEALRAWIAGGQQPQVADLQTGCQAAISAGAAGPCRFDATIVPPSFDSQVAARPASTAAPVDARYNGSWYDSARSGEGIILEILPNNKAGMFFFTYPPAGVSGQQAWVYGVGDVIGNGIEFANVLRPLRDATGKVTNQPWGRIALTFSDCNTASMRWDGPANWGSMEVPLGRLSELNGLGCASNGSAPAQASGGWYDPATSGDGFLFEQVNAQQLGVLYFGSNPDGTQTWLEGLGAPGSDGSYNMTMIEPQGTLFGAAFDESKITKPAAFQLHGLTLACNTGAATLTPLANILGTSQQFALQRLTQLLGVASCSP